MQAQNSDPLYPPEIKVCIRNALIKVLPLSCTPWILRCLNQFYWLLFWKLKGNIHFAAGKFINDTVFTSEYCEQMAAECILIKLMHQVGGFSCLFFSDGMGFSEVWILSWIFYIQGNKNVWFETGVMDNSKRSRRPARVWHDVLFDKFNINSRFLNNFLTTNWMLK